MKQSVYSSRTADKFVVRLPDGMRDKLAEVARNRLRSMNSEIVARLAASLEADGEGENAAGVEVESADCTTKWCPSIGEAVNHEHWGPGVLREFKMKDGKLMAGISFEGNNDYFELWPHCTVKPFIVKVEL